MRTIKKLVVGLFNGRGRRTCLRTLRVAFGNVPSEAKLLRCMLSQGSNGRGRPLSQCMLSQMLVLLVAAGLCGAGNAFADVVTEGNLLFDTETGTITGRSPEFTGGDIVIPETIQDIKVTAIGEGAFQQCEALGSVTIPASVTNIGVCAFENSTALSNVTFAADSKVAEIGVSAFLGCTALGSVTIPANVTNIGVRAFENCYILSNVTFAADSELAVICEGAFRACWRLNSVTIPASVTSIRDAAFYDCRSLSNVTMQAVTPPMLGSDVFYDVSASVKIHVPETSAAAYSAADNWESYFQKFDPWGVGDGAWARLVDGVLTISGTGAVDKIEWSGNYPWVDSKSEIFSVVVGKDITGIGDDAFRECTALSNVTFVAGSKLAKIGKCAFQFCTSLSNVTFAADSELAVIGEGAFQLCRALGSVTIPASVKSIGSEAFFECHALSNVTFAADSQLAEIGSQAFLSCISLARITIPEDVTNICAEAFSGCLQLFDVTMESSHPPILGDEYVFLPTRDGLLIHVPAGSADAYWAADTWKHDRHLVAEPVVGAPDYLHFTACDMTATLELQRIGEDPAIIAMFEYSKDGGEVWTPYEPRVTGPIEIGNGETVWFRRAGDRSSSLNGTLRDGYRFVSEFVADGGPHPRFEAGGNVMSLLDPKCELTYVGEFAFTRLFYDFDGLKVAPELPAKSVANNAYEEMFAYSGLKNAPELPAMELGGSCYYNMFHYCVEMTTAPVELPATNLAVGCYSSMFAICRSMTNAPALPATDLAEECYCRMFGSCRALKVAPVLPSMKFAQRSCADMFSDSSLLDFITVGFTEFPNTELWATEYWLYDVAPVGAFFCPPELQAALEASGERSESTVPENWFINPHHFTVQPLPAGFARFEVEAGRGAVSRSPTYYVDVNDAVTIKYNLQPGYVFVGGETTAFTAERDGMTVGEGEEDDVHFPEITEYWTSLRAALTNETGTISCAAFMHRFENGTNFVTLAKDVYAIINGGALEIGPDAVVDLCGHTIGGHETIGSCFLLPNGSTSTLLVKDSQLGGTISGAPNGVTCAGGTFVMTGGTITGCARNGVDLEGGSAVLIGGTIVGNAKGSKANNPYAGVFDKAGALYLGGSLAVTGNVYNVAYLVGEGASAAPIVIGDDEMTVAGFVVLGLRNAFAAGVVRIGCTGGAYASATGAFTLNGDEDMVGRFFTADDLSLYPDFVEDHFELIDRPPATADVVTVQQYYPWNGQVDIEYKLGYVWPNRTYALGITVEAGGQTLTVTNEAAVTPGWKTITTIDCGETFPEVNEDAHVTIEVIETDPAKQSAGVMPFCVTALTPSMMVGFVDASRLDGEAEPWSCNLEYSFDGKSWEPLEATDDLGATAYFVTLEHAGDKVYFRGDNPDGFNSLNLTTEDAKYGVFLAMSMLGEDALVSVSGNIMSLVDPEMKMTEIPGEAGCFARLFLADLSTIHSAGQLLLPATTLKPACYMSMFTWQEKLLDAPDLPAETLAPFCYALMFEECTNLRQLKMMATDIGTPDDYCLVEWVAAPDSGSATLFINPEATWCSGPDDAFLPEGWTVKPAIEIEPCDAFCVTAGDANLFVGFFDFGKNLMELDEWSPNLQYSRDGKTWVDCERQTLPVLYMGAFPVEGYGLVLPNAGDRVFFRGDNSSGFNSLILDEGGEPVSGSVGAFIAQPLPTETEETQNEEEEEDGEPSAWVTVSGNIMSLVDPTMQTTEIPDGVGCFTYLFVGDGSDMGASSIFSADRLRLPATTLKEGCYETMFVGQDLMIGAPELPARTLEKNCYKMMFTSCYSLRYVKMMATDIGASEDDCLFNWIGDRVGDSGTLFINPEGTWYQSEADRDKAQVPQDWAVVDAVDDAFASASAAGASRSDEATVVTSVTETDFGLDLRTAVALPAGVTVVSNVTWSSALQVPEENEFGPLMAKNVSVVIGYTNLTDGTTGVLLEPVKSMGVADVTLPAAIGDYRLTHRVNNGQSLLSFATFTVDAVLHPEGSPENPWKVGAVQPEDVLASTNGNGGLVITGKGAIGDKPWTGDEIKDGITEVGIGPGVTVTADDFAGLDNLEKIVVPHGQGETTKATLGDPLAALVEEAPNYLAFTARGGAVTIGMEKYSTLDLDRPLLETAMSPMGPWTTFTAGETTIPLAADETIYFRRSVPAATDRINGLNGDVPFWFFTMTPQTEGATVAASGNIMSLLDQTCASDTVGELAFNCLFYSCAVLTDAPELPAMNLAKDCYFGIFTRCTALTNAPALPAMNLKKECYNGMFLSCTSLKTAPELPARILTDVCYGSLFSRCGNLDAISVAFTNWNDGYATLDWVNEVAATGVFTCPIELPVIKGVCYIPEGWVVRKRFTLPGPTAAGSYVVSNALGQVVEPIETVPGGNLYEVPVAGADDTISIYAKPAAGYVVHGQNPLTINLTTGGEMGELPVATRDYLSFTAVRPTEEGVSVFGSALTCTTDKGEPLPLEWTDDPVNGPWTDVEYGVALPLVADKTVYLRKKGSDIALTANGLQFMFSGNAFVEAHGNVMSLLDQTCQSVTVGEKAFYRLFYNCEVLTTAPELPAMTLEKGCYESMFNGCTALTSAPALSATELAAGCYGYMFSGCTALTDAPELAATTLALSCYYSMFSGCAALTNAPELAATTLAEKCYREMFSGCTALTAAPELAATTLAEHCYREMFSGCTALTNAPELAATTLTDYCYYGMFQNCTALTTAPELSATTLAERCYGYMFFGCTALTNAPELAVTTLADYCYYRMFQNCTALMNAPALSATTLVEYGYADMFSGCTNVDFVSVGFTNWNPSTATVGWLTKVAETGTFVAPYELNVGVARGGNTIPVGWNVVGGHIECTLPAMDGGVYVVSNLTEGAEAAAIAPVAGSTYWLPVGARVEIYCVAEDGYVIHGANPYVIPAVATDTVIVSGELPVAELPATVTIVSAKSARTEGAWSGAVQVVYELHNLHEGRNYSLTFDLTAAGQFGSCTTNLPSAVVDGVYTQDVNRIEFFGPESQVEDPAAELTLKLIEK